MRSKNDFIHSVTGGYNPTLPPPPTERALFNQLKQVATFSIAELPVVKNLPPSEPGHDSATPKLAIGSHLGYGRIGLRTPTAKLSDAEFLRTTKALLDDKDLWYEKTTECALALSKLLGHLPILTIACDGCKAARDGSVEFIPIGGPSSTYARYLSILTQRMDRVIMIPTNGTDGHPFTLKHGGLGYTRKASAVSEALTPFIEVIKRHIALSPARPYLFGGAIGVCLRDTAQALGIQRGDGVLLDQASYTNFPEELPIDQPHEIWRAEALEEAPYPRLVLEDLRSTYSPTRRFETKRLGFPVLKFRAEGEGFE